MAPLVLWFERVGRALIATESNGKPRAIGSRDGLGPFAEHHPAMSAGHLS